MHKYSGIVWHNKYFQGNLQGTMETKILPGKKPEAFIHERVFALETSMLTAEHNMIEVLIHLSTSPAPEKICSTQWLLLLCDDLLHVPVKN